MPTAPDVLHGIDLVVPAGETHAIVGPTGSGKSIWVLEAGRIAESGTHDELIAHDGSYAALWRLQTGDAVVARG